MARAGRALRLILINSVAMLYWMPRGARLSLLRLAGVRVGHATIFSGSIFRADGLVIGDGTFINHNCVFDRGPITIGRNVYISYGVILAGSSHEAGTAEQRAGRDFAAPITVGDGAWLGANVVVLAGVTIASGCVVAAGAVVTHDTARDGVYAGVPARRLRDLDPV